jgi:hypothetical protein
MPTRNGISEASLSGMLFHKYNETDHYHKYAERVINNIPMSTLSQLTNEQ